MDINLRPVIFVTESPLDPKATDGQDVIMAEKTEVSAERPPSLINVTHLIYALHSLSLLIGLTTAATIVGAFVFGLPSIIAVVINYVKKEEAKGTFLASHFRWQIRTFWFALLWCVIGAVLFATFVGIPLAVAIWLGVSVWVIYRIARGWLALRDRKPMYT